MSNYPQVEESIVKLWDINKIPAAIIEKTVDYPKRIFYDGPPFATGMPHYGHILVGTVKDTITRFFRQNHLRIDGNYGWDTHGVPIEMKAKEKIGYKTKEELIDFGIDKHNALCRRMVEDHCGHWNPFYQRMGRWVDPSLEYFTLEPSYMESVMWAFSKLHADGLIFEGYKVMPYSYACTTALSNFEAKQDYRDVITKSITVKFKVRSTEKSTFKLTDDNPCYLLVWTTTPWTLPSNMAICTNDQMQLVQIFDTDNSCYYLLSRELFDKSFKKNSKRYRKIIDLIGHDVIGLDYDPIFMDFYQAAMNIDYPNTKPFSVVTDGYVKESGDGSGTGFVHLSPAHGEDDFRVCQQYNIIDKRNSRRNIINLIDDDGKFMNDFKLTASMLFTDANDIIIKHLKNTQVLFEQKDYKHSYPFCYRTGTPLLYKLVTGWFLGAGDSNFRAKLLAANSKINWKPANVGTKHFHEWLENSVDWCISRSRYWGTPIPVWRSTDGLETVCVGSIKELSELSGIDNITDLHIDHIDKIKIPSKEGRGLLSRVEGVLDCWFESGCVPYGQINYPYADNSDVDFANREFIGDFITESKDQTRGWFYTLNVLSVALFNKPAFKNVIVTGIVLGADGEKMSKSKGNFTDPMIIINKYGADTMRLYLLSTPLLKAESVKFDDSSLKKIQQVTLDKLVNMFSFLIEKINFYNKLNPSEKFVYDSDTSTVSNVLDLWILNKTQKFINDLHKSLNNYELVGQVYKIIDHIEQLTNWYLKMARDRIKGSTSRNPTTKSDWLNGLKTLSEVLFKTVLAISSFIPFTSERLYQDFKQYTQFDTVSIHLLDYPFDPTFKTDSKLERKFEVVQTVINLVREVRDKLKLNLRRPLKSISVGSYNKSDLDVIADVLYYINSESNVMQVNTLNDITMKIRVEPNLSTLSIHMKELSKAKFIKKVGDYIKALPESMVLQFITDGKLLEPESEVVLTPDYVNIKYDLPTELANLDTMVMTNGIVMCCDPIYDIDVKSKHLVSAINMAIQHHRKEQKFKPWDVVKMTYYSDSIELVEFIKSNINSFIGLNTTEFVFGKLSEQSTKHEVINTDTIIYLSSALTSVIE